VCVCVHGWGWSDVVCQTQSQYCDGSLSRRWLCRRLHGRWAVQAACPSQSGSALVDKGPTGLQGGSLYLDWSRSRDHGIITLPNSEHVSAFEQQLENRHPPDIKWVAMHGREAEYADTSYTLSTALFRLMFLVKGVAAVFFRTVAMPCLS